MTEVKFCGLTRIEDAEAVNRIRPGYAGFVFWDKSKRNLSKSQAKILRNTLDKDIKTVGVFVDADIDFIVELVSEGIINMIQLHGHEDEKYIECLRGRLRTVLSYKTDGEFKEIAITSDSSGKDVPIIKAFEVKNREDIERADISSADYILLDAGKGEGKTFSWELISGIQRKYFLAGGLECRNAIEAIKSLHPYALDVSSGIETDGVKDAEKMEAFMSAVRSADSE